MEKQTQHALELLDNYWRTAQMWLLEHSEASWLPTFEVVQSAKESTPKNRCYSSSSEFSDWERKAGIRNTELLPKDLIRMSSEELSSPSLVYWSEEKPMKNVFEFMEMAESEPNTPQKPTPPLVTIKQETPKKEVGARFIPGLAKIIQ